MFVVGISGLYRLPDKILRGDYIKTLYLQRTHFAKTTCVSSERNGGHKAWGPSESSPLPHHCVVMKQLKSCLQKVTEYIFCQNFLRSCSIFFSFL